MSSTKGQTVEVLYEWPPGRSPQFTLSEVMDSESFRNWAERANLLADIALVRVYAVHGWPDAYGMPEVRMLHLGVTVRGTTTEVATFLRGPSVDMLVVLTDGQRRYLVHVDQERIPAGQMVRSNPAGMVDPGEEPQLAALRELTEELGVMIHWGAMVCLNKRMFGSHDYPLLGSPGGSDEEVMYYAATATLSTDDLRALHGKLTGQVYENERLIVHLTPFGQGRKGVMQAIESLAVHGRADTKAVLALLAYYVYLDYDN